MGSSSKIKQCVELLISLAATMVTTRKYAIWRRTLSTRGLWTCNGPLTRYVTLGVAHAPGMPGAFPALPRVSDPDMHHDTCVTHVPGCMQGSLTSRFRWSRWRGKRCRHSRRMRNPHFYVSGKRPIHKVLRFERQFSGKGMSVDTLIPMMIYLVL